MNGRILFDQMLGRATRLCDFGGTDVKDSRRGRTPSLRNASLLTAEAWRPSRLKAMALQMLSMQLGGRHLRPTCKSPNVGDDFRRLVASAAERIQVPADRCPQALPL